jgi:hypothetical protein
MSSITRKSRLLCAVCGDLQKVTNVEHEPSTIVTLKCGHERGELLPSRPGSISIETLSRGKKV